MATRTRTGTTHWDVQWTRRRQLVDDWRANHRTIIKAADVVMQPSARGHRVGCYMGEDGGNPTRTLDAWVHEYEPGSATTIHRHSWDAMLFVVSGSGWTEVDGVRYDWQPWDAIHIPAWSWHRSGGTGERPARVMSYSSEPLVSSLGFGVLEDAGDTPVGELPPRPPFTSDVEGDDVYARRVRRLAAQQLDRRSGRIHTDYDSEPLRLNPKGTRSKFLIDRSIGHRASGITQVMLQFAPGKGQARHLHPGEAWLYVVEGRGESYLGEEETGGEWHPWEQGDLVVVDHSLWHQHRNTDPDKPARLVRIHAFDSVLETMRLLCYPQELFLEPKKNLEEMGDITAFDWPEGDARPSA
jgi:gentisate 1,2-dioxygenase